MILPYMLLALLVACLLLRLLSVVLNKLERPQPSPQEELHVQMGLREDRLARLFLWNVLSGKKRSMTRYVIWERGVERNARLRRQALARAMFPASEEELREVEERCS